MKRLITLLAIAAFSLTGFAQGYKINWMTVEEALAAQQKEPRKIMVDMYTTWCGPCKMLDKYTFQNKDVAEYVNENFYAVKFNAEGGAIVQFKDQTFLNPNYDASRRGRNSQHQLASYFGVSAYPTIVFLDENANLLTPVKGFHKPNQLEIYLKIFASDDYKSVTTKDQWLDYQKNFKPEFN
ncbi:MAG: thioredoxin fold domain-containing protein [Flavobacteriaceae bacterium]|nr:thioredoxin fold domain-containing protein [Flavobacteriaceae bacterium]